MFSESKRIRLDSTKSNSDLGFYIPSLIGKSFGIFLVIAHGKLYIFLDRCCSVLAQNFPYQTIIERANWPEFPPDLRARLAAHSFPKSARQIRNYYGVPKISAKEVKQIGFRVIGKMWAGQQVCLDVDRGAIIRAECSCGGEGPSSTSCKKCAILFRARFQCTISVHDLFSDCARMKLSQNCARKFCAKIMHGVISN